MIRILFNLRSYISTAYLCKVTRMEAYQELSETHGLRNNAVIQCFSSGGSRNLNFRQNLTYSTMSPQLLFLS